MRPGEVRIMRGCDLNMAGEVWEYRPQTHKTEHHGRDRMVFIGPKGQGIIREYLMTDLQAYLFSPLDGRIKKGRRNELYSK
jgi:integrase